MKPGKELEAGDVVLATVQYTDTFETKIRPALVLYSEDDNVVVAGITSNLNRTGISLTIKEGAIKDSVIRLNYIFTISGMMVGKYLFSLTNAKKKIVWHELNRRLSQLCA